MNIVVLIMRCAASIQCNINIISTCLFLVACFVTIYCVQPTEANFECHEHRNVANVETIRGIYLMGRCTSPLSICYESYVTKKDINESYAIYKAGCSVCTTNPDEVCRTCNTPLCNDVLVRKIKAKNRQCIVNESGGEDVYGSLTSHCAHWVKHCYYQRIQGKNGPIFEAGCGKAKTETPDQNAKSCSTNLCNVPKHVTNIKLSAERNLRTLEKTSYGEQQEETDTESATDTESNDGTKVTTTTTDGTDVTAGTTDKKNVTTVKKRHNPEDAEDMYDNSSDTQTVAWTTWTVLSMIGIWHPILISIGQSAL